jgi:hypothetical protein
MGRLIVVNVKENTQANGTDTLAARARDAVTAAAAAAQTAATAAQTAATAAQAAAQEMSSAAQTAASSVNKGVREGVYRARVWTAPRLESAADYTTETMAPKVSSALRDAARQVSPEDMRRKNGHSALTWSLLGAAVLAAAGAVAAMVRHRYRSAMAADTAEDASAGTAPAGTTKPDGSADSADTPAATSPDAGVNGRVSASDR